MKGSSKDPRRAEEIDDISSTKHDDYLSVHGCDDEIDILRSKLHTKGPLLNLIVDMDNLISLEFARVIEMLLRADKLVTFELKSRFFYLGGEHIPGCNMWECVINKEIEDIIKNAWLMEFEVPLR